MRRRKDESTPITPNRSSHDNAFAPELFDELRRRDSEPAAPDGDLPGPWRVTRLWGDGPPLWAVYGLGERTPRASFEQPDLAYLTAAALALAERSKRFHFQENTGGSDGTNSSAGSDTRPHLVHDGQRAGTIHSPVLQHTTLATDLTRLADLRVQPLALAQLLSATPAAVLERAGAILMDELRKGR